MIIENFKDDKEALRAMTGELVRYMDRKDDGLPFNLALSGGGTAQNMFALCSSRCIYPSVMCTAFMEKWNLVRKRCVIRVS